MVEYQQSISLPSDPEKENYIFMGWVDDLGNAFELTNMPANDIDLYETWGKEVEQWQLVTNVNDLSVDDQIVIVAKDTNVALSTTQNNNNRGQVSISKNTANNTVTINSSVQILTLTQGKISGTFGFYTGKGYLYAASSSNNYLKTETNLSDNSSWLISISEGVATIKSQGTYTRNWLKYNSTSSLFSCYGSGQKDIQIYKLEAYINKVELINISYDTNGGNESIESIDTQKTLTITLNNGSSLSKDGYTFLGWASTSDATVAEYVSPWKYSFSENTVLYAVWKENVILSFNANGGTGSIESIEKVKGSTFVIPSIEGIEIPTNMIFKEWNSSADGTGISYEEGQSIELEENLELYAIWEEESTVTLSFNANGGTGSIESIIQEKYSTFIVPSIDGLDAPSGKIFKEWNSSADGTGISYEEGQSIELDANLELFAIWEDISYVVLSFNVNGGTGSIESIEKVKGSIFSVPSIGGMEAPANKIFKEWNTKADGTGTSYKADDTIELETSLELFAIWKDAKITSSISFSSTTQRTSFSTSQQVWEQNGITFTNIKGSSTTNVADYSNPVRLYANSQIIVEAVGKITEIVFDCNSSTYATALKNSIGTVSGVTVSVSSDKVTVTFSTDVVSFTIAKLTAQVRMDSITVTYMA